MLEIPEPWKPGVNGVDSVMTFTAIDGKQEKIVTPAVSLYPCEVEAMEACIRRREPVVPLSRSRHFLQSALAQYRSAATSQVVAIG